MKSNYGAIVTEEGVIQEVWRGYSSNILNEENLSEIQDVCCVECPVLDVFEEEVEKALKALKANKAPGPCGVFSDLLKSAGRPEIQQLTRVT